MPLVDHKKHKYDIDINWNKDLEFGKKYEEKIRAVFEDDGRVEVKTERDIWRDKGNIAIEYGTMKSGYRKNSGIGITEAKWWMCVLSHEDEMKLVIMMSVEKLKKLARKYYDKGSKTTGGDGGCSCLVLIPLKEIVTWMD